jgi:hypothetical protein
LTPCTPWCKLDATRKVRTPARGVHHPFAQFLYSAGTVVASVPPIAIRIPNNSFDKTRLLDWIGFAILLKARRLGIRIRREEEGTHRKTSFAHTLNATACAVGKEQRTTQRVCSWSAGRILSSLRSPVRCSFFPCGGWVGGWVGGESRWCQPASQPFRVVCSLAQPFLNASPSIIISIAPNYLSFPHSSRTQPLPATRRPCPLLAHIFQSFSRLSVKGHTLHSRSISPS